MLAGFTEPFAKRLDSLCAVAVCEAKHGEIIEPGVVYIAPAGTHLTVDRSSSRTALCLSDKPEPAACSFRRCDDALGSLGFSRAGDGDHHDGNGIGWGARNEGDSSGGWFYGGPG